MISQRNCGQFIRSSPSVRKINRKITLAFHYFACIEKNASQLFFPGDIENINQVIGIYEKYDKKLLSTFYLLINFCREKNIPEEQNIKLLIENTKKELQFLLGSKNLDKKKKVLVEKQKKIFFLMRNFFFDMKLFLVRIFFLI